VSHPLVSELHLHLRLLVYQLELLSYLQLGLHQLLLFVSHPLLSKLRLRQLVYPLELQLYLQLALRQL
jgi:hypothetical protein